MPNKRFNLDPLMYALAGIVIGITIAIMIFSPVLPYMAIHYNTNMMALNIISMISIIGAIIIYYWKPVKKQDKQEIKTESKVII